MNFADSRNLVNGLTVEGSSISQPGKWFAQDSDFWLFPLLDWTESSKQAFTKGFQKVGEASWNYKFLLLTPRDYAEFDFADNKGGWRVRPNVICLFKLLIVGAGSTVQASDTISGNLTPHRTISVVKLDPSTRSVNRLTANKAENGRFTKSVTGPMNGKTWRSNSGELDDNDLFKPKHNTIGHEVGHLLSEDHVKCLGPNPLAICKTDGNDDSTYGTNPADPNDGGNLMGGGDALTLLNADPWTNRILQHTYRRFVPTLSVGTQPRKISLGESIQGKASF